MFILAKWVGRIAGFAVMAIACGASAQTYTNSTPIIINDYSTTPYPSTISVAGAPTSIADVKVTLNVLSHTYASDMKVLLVAPNGTGIKLFEVASNSNDFINMNVAFASDATASFPTVPASGVYMPTGGNTTFGGTLVGPGAPSFAPVIGSNANGTWRLYVLDTLGSDTGTMAGGWTIEFYERNHPLHGFTYQGRLDGASPGDEVTLRFTAYDSLTSPSPLDWVAGPVTASTTVASDGTVTVPVDFGNMLPVDRQLYMQIDVSLANAPFVALSPRQPIAPAPVAFVSVEAAHALAADWASTAVSSTTADSAAVATNATNAVNATNATHAISADSATSADNAASLGGVAAAAFARRDTTNSFNADQTIATSNMLSFGTIGNGTNTAENSDLIGFRRFNANTNQSELRLTIGDDPLANVDAFSIGYTTNGATFAEVFRLQANGVALKPGGGAWTAFSDRRLKHNIRPLTSSLDRLLGLHGVSFEYNDPKGEGACEGTMMGFIAQDVEPLFPRWISTSSDGYKMLTITGFEALAVEALRELRAEKDAQIAERDAQIAQLRDAISAMQQQHARELGELERRLERLEAPAQK